MSKEPLLVCAEESTMRMHGEGEGQWTKRYVEQLDDDPHIARAVHWPGIVPVSSTLLPWMSTTRLRLDTVVAIPLRGGPIAYPYEVDKPIRSDLSLRFLTSFLIVAFQFSISLLRKRLFIYVRPQPTTPNYFEAFSTVSFTYSGNYNMAITFFDVFFIVDVEKSLGRLLNEKLSQKTLRLFKNGRWPMFGGHHPGLDYSKFMYHDRYNVDGNQFF